MKKFTFAASLLVIQIAVVTGIIASTLLPAAYLLSGEFSTPDLVISLQLGLIAGTVMTVAWMGLLTLSPAIAANILTPKMTRRLVRYGVLEPEFNTPHFI